MSVITDIFKGGASGIFDGVAKIIGTFKADPTQVAQLQAEMYKIQAELDGKIVAADAAVVTAINQTMQGEAKSEHWLQWSWRPTVGLTFCVTIINNYVLYPYFAKLGMEQITIPDTVWLAMLTVLGAAAYTRGMEKIEAVKHG